MKRLELVQMEDLQGGTMDPATTCGLGVGLYAGALALSFAFTGGLATVAIIGLAGSGMVTMVTSCYKL